MCKQLHLHDVMLCISCMCKLFIRSCDFTNSFAIDSDAKFGCENLKKLGCTKRSLNLSKRTFRTPPSFECMIRFTFPCLSSTCAMASLTESRAVFKERASEVGLDDATRTLLENQGITTLAKLAFAVGQPGETPTEGALRGMVAGGGDPGAVALGVVSSLRRLIFEAQTLLIAQVKTLVENKVDETKLEMAPAERTHRIADQRGRLVGMTLTGELECGYCCYDLVMKLAQHNSIVYLPPHKFVSRKAELGLDKPKKELTIEANSTVTVKDKSQELSCSTSTDLHLQEALTRRALALDLVGIASFARVEEYTRFLMSQLQNDAPPGYSKTSIQQVLRADKEAWLR